MSDFGVKADVAACLKKLSFLRCKRANLDFGLANNLFAGGGLGQKDLFDWMCSVLEVRDKPSRSEKGCD